MKFLLINQCFYPDVVSTAQHLTDLARELTRRGHSVTVLAGRRGYDNPSQRFAKREVWQGITIYRIASTGFGKSRRLYRTLDFASFMIHGFARMLILPKVDAVVSLTSPPLISSLAALFALLKRKHFYFWIMDLNPDEAIAAGWLKKKSFTAKILAAILRFSMKRARRVIVLDRFMKERLLSKNVPENKISVVPPWAHDQYAVYSPEGRSAFRASHGLADKFIVMYSGNHSPCHPLDTLLQTACRLADNSEIHFLFIGGGSEFGKTKIFADENGLRNIHFLPYQPLEKLAESLSSADLHVAVMGNAFTGIVHPCKIYNILSIGSPFLYIGPEDSPIEDIIKSLGKRCDAYSARHGDVNSVVEAILEAKAKRHKGAQLPLRELAQCFSGTALLPKIIAALECMPPEDSGLEISWDPVKLGFPK